VDEAAGQRAAVRAGETTVDADRRSLARALSWRVVAWALTVGIAYLFTGHAVVALAIGVADSLLKIFAYYLHERSWMSLDRARQPAARPAFAVADERRGLASAR
jgi:adenylylsulfate kinase